ncbi:MAG: GIY-YIG nuclease family protein, partial [candidate division Zixibacteria bacterium]|nr:GIY-YIG nuclease family protein [candidate division Zixibacteria bacterium]NIR48829.1 GIY-YIG nuclease family protein [candidate division KSB1 bacterium]NIR64135.1 GIY-YIG nuclease family protein [candidate division Zixibacteria bacterium]NIS46037.1 GIY-YIG nuclease family protein [candidate division Zixibacteria bacterium]NIU14157.1 GIY-YIG nuclease family protein [candidate division Zixibacteria bacterium]
MEKVSYYVYILASNRGTLYTGVTNDLLRRVKEHRDGFGSIFTKKYAVHRLIYSEEFQYVEQAIEMEKKIKSWSR